MVFYSKLVFQIKLLPTCIIYTIIKQKYRVFIYLFISFYNYEFNGYIYIYIPGVRENNWPLPNLRSESVQLTFPSWHWLLLLNRYAAVRCSIRQHEQDVLPSATVRFKMCNNTLPDILLFSNWIRKMCAYILAISLGINNILCVISTNICSSRVLFIYVHKDV